MGQPEYKSVSEHTELIKGEMRTQVKEVIIENGVGTVKVKYVRGSDGSVLAEHTEPLTDDQVAAILDKRIVPDLFKPCILGCGSAADEQTPRNAAANAAERAGAEMQAAEARAERLLGGGRRRSRYRRRTMRRRNN